MLSSEDLRNQFIACMPTFIALGEETRLQIVDSLAGSTPIDRVGLNVNEITERTSLSRPAVSHHLKILREAGLVDIRREGTSNYYYLTIVEGNRRLKRLSALLDQIIDEMGLTK